MVIFYIEPIKVKIHREKHTDGEHFNTPLNINGSTFTWLPQFLDIGGETSKRSSSQNRPPPFFSSADWGAVKEGRDGGQPQEGGGGEVGGGGGQQEQQEGGQSEPKEAQILALNRTVGSCSNNAAGSYHSAF